MPFRMVDLLLIGYDLSVKRVCIVYHIYVPTSHLYNYHFLKPWKVLGEGYYIGGVHLLVKVIDVACRLLLLQCVGVWKWSFSLSLSLSRVISQVSIVTHGPLSPSFHLPYPKSFLPPTCFLSLYPLSLSLSLSHFPDTFIYLRRTRNN